MKRLLPRALVALTVLVVLGVGGYAGQVWWAKRIALTVWNEIYRAPPLPGEIRGPYVIQEWVLGWRHTSWYGRFNSKQPWWTPRRGYYEVLVLWSDLDLPNDPEVWEAWFKAHPNLVWDAKQKRLVEPKP